MYMNLELGCTCNTVLKFNILRINSPLSYQVSNNCYFFETYNIP